MTDQRIIECAMALFEASDGAARYVTTDESGPVTWETLSDYNRKEWLLAARACILKWLEQEPSEGMVAATVRDHTCFVYEEPIEGKYAFQRPLYATMTAQARKEIDRP